MAGHELPALASTRITTRPSTRPRTKSIRSSAPRSTSSATTCLWQEHVFIPVMHRIKVGASANTLRPVMSGWANDLDNLQDWYRET